jgi:hypothetical protein
LFRKYRKVSVEKPIFVTGIPRSGTTHLQRVLAKDEQLTSMQTWECVLAPSISERHFYRLIGRAIQPLGQLFSKVSLPFFQNMKSIHHLGLSEAEEDFIALLPINACFLLVVLFPNVSHYWRLSQFDSAMSSEHKEKILTYYHRIIQKHLYFHGQDKRYLCKNPSYFSWVQSLSSHFPNASFILCEREPSKTVPSQLSSLQPIWTVLYGEKMSDDFSKRIVGMMAKNYHYLDRLPLEEVNAMRLPMSLLVNDLRAAVVMVQEHSGIVNTPQFSSELEREVSQATRYKSKHHYSDSSVYGWQAHGELFPSAENSCKQVEV